MAFAELQLVFVRQERMVPASIGRLVTKRPQMGTVNLLSSDIRKDGIYVS
jgi:hypothetical protein